MSKAMWQTKFVYNKEKQTYELTGPITCRHEEMGKYLTPQERIKVLCQNAKDSTERKHKVWDEINHCAQCTLEWYELILTNAEMLELTDSQKGSYKEGWLETIQRVDMNGEWDVFFSRTWYLGTPGERGYSYWNDGPHKWGCYYGVRDNFDTQSADEICRTIATAEAETQRFPYWSYYIMKRCEMQCWSIMKAAEMCGTYKCDENQTTLDMFGFVAQCSAASLDKDTCEDSEIRSLYKR